MALAGRASRDIVHLHLVLLVAFEKLVTVLRHSDMVAQDTVAVKTVVQMFVEVKMAVQVFVEVQTVAQEV